MEIGKEEKLLLALLNEGLRVKEPVESKTLSKADGHTLSGIDWDKLENTARRHSVLSLLCYPCLGTEEIPEKFRTSVQKEARGIVLQNYHLLLAGRDMVELLAESGIPTAVLKGAAAARSYPEPGLLGIGETGMQGGTMAACPASCGPLDGGWDRGRGAYHAGGAF